MSIYKSIRTRVLPGARVDADGHQLTGRKRRWARRGRCVWMFGRRRGWRGGRETRESVRRLFGDEEQREDHAEEMVDEGRDHSGEEVGERRE